MSGTPFIPPRFIPVSSTGRPYPGCKLYFYDAGTTTLKTVYTDSALLAPSQNPLIASSAGMFSAVYVDPTAGNYKAVLTNSSGAQLWSEDNLPSGSVSAEEVGHVLYPRSASEISASVTPTFYQYPPGDVRRYGAIGDGSANDTPSIQAAIDVAEANFTAGGAEVYLPAGRSYYRTTTALTINENGVTLRGDGAGSVIRNTGTGNVLTVTDTSDVHLVGVNFASTAASVSCVSLNTALNTRFDRCFFVTEGTLSNGITSTASYCCTVTNCTFGSITGWGIYAENSANAWYIAGNRLDGKTVSATGGVYIYGQGNVLIGNTIETFDICVQAAGNGLKFCNYMESYRRGYNFIATDTQGVSISGNFNSDSAATSVYISAGTGYTINDVQFTHDHSSGAPVELTSGPSNVFIGPNITYTDNYAVKWPINHVVLGHHLLADTLVSAEPGSLTAVTHTGTVAGTVIKTTTLTKEHLGTGTHISVRAAGTISGTAGTKAMALAIGSYTIATVTESSGETADWIIEAEIDIASATIATGSVRAYQGAALEAVDVFSTSSLDLTTTNPTVTLTATLGSVGDSIVLTQWQVALKN